MLIDDPHHLLLIIGDHGQDGWQTGPDIPVLPDDIEAHLGKSVRLDLATGEVQILTVGHRNPQGMVRSKDGRVWATEHGPEGGDELNLLRPRRQLRLALRQLRDRRLVCQEVDWPGKEGVGTRSQGDRRGRADRKCRRA